MLAQAAKAIGHWLFGGTCFLCHGAAQKGLLCNGCDADLPRLSADGCPRCALPTAGPCGRCLARPPQFDATVAALAYAFPADVLVHALKFRGELAVAPLLAQLLAQRTTAAERPDCLVAVPISERRLRERGYNQALEIARHLARATGVPLTAQLCRRTRDTLPQTDLPWGERAANVRGAFVAGSSALGVRIAVVDDVMTTGATLNEIAATLKRAGAQSVQNWVVARTPEPG